jgi:hypothetical protein
MQSDLFGPEIPRRSALSLLTLGAASLAVEWSSPVLAAGGSASPLLAPPAQVAAEMWLLELLGDPGLKRIQRELETELSAMPRGQTRDGAATIERAIAQWTNSVIFGEISDLHRHDPVILWATDNTPRTWLGHTLGGVGMLGDNPDAIYRIGALDSTGRFELIGRFDKENPAVQLVFEVDRGSLARPGDSMNTGGDMVRTVKMFTNRDLVLEPDGSFRITMGGPPTSPNHIELPAGPLMFGVRDMLADWGQRPAKLAIRRIDEFKPKTFSPEELRQQVLTDLPGFVRFWSAIPDVIFGGLKPNTIAEPKGRENGWGFVAGMRYELQPDEAIVVTTSRKDAPYTGFQVVDPWMIAPDGKRHQASLNLSQALPNGDGTFTYVIAPSDPGVANWLDTGGIHSGFGILRWQGTSAQSTKDGLIREFKVTKLSEIASRSDLTRVYPQQRRNQLDARAIDQARRTL